jgi:hypothetical protein
MNSYNPISFSKEFSKEYDDLILSTLNEWYKTYYKYADTNFDTNIENNFPGKFWEIYIWKILSENNIEFNIPRKDNEGPDLITTDNIYIECTCIEKGASYIKNKDGKKVFNVNRVPDMKSDIYNFNIKAEDIKIEKTPVNNITLRYTNAIHEKKYQYDNWKDKKWYNANAPYILAINTGELEFIQTDDISYIVKVLFNVGDKQLDKDGNISWKELDLEKILKQDIKEQIKDIKKNTSCYKKYYNQFIKSILEFENIKVGHFKSTQYSWISAIIFTSSNDIISQLNDIGSDCIYIENPFAKNKIDINKFSFFKNVPKPKPH